MCKKILAKTFVFFMALSLLLGTIVPMERLKAEEVEEDLVLIDEEVEVENNDLDLEGTNDFKFNRYVDQFVPENDTEEFLGVYTFLEGLDSNKNYRLEFEIPAELEAYFEAVTPTTEPFGYVEVDGVKRFYKLAYPSNGVMSYDKTTNSIIWEIEGFNLVDTSEVFSFIQLGLKDEYASTNLDFIHPNVATRVYEINEANTLIFEAVGQEDMDYYVYPGAPRDPGHPSASFSMVCGPGDAGPSHGSSGGVLSNCGGSKKPDNPSDTKPKPAPPANNTPAPAPVNPTAAAPTTTKETKSKTNSNFDEWYKTWSRPKDTPPDHMRPSIPGETGGPVRPSYSLPGGYVPGGPGIPIGPGHPGAPTYPTDPRTTTTERPYTPSPGTTTTTRAPYVPSPGTARPTDPAKPATSNTTTTKKTDGNAVSTGEDLVPSENTNKTENTNTPNTDNNTPATDKTNKPTVDNKVDIGKEDLPSGNNEKPADTNNPKPSLDKVDDNNQDKTEKPTVKPTEKPLPELKVKTKIFLVGEGATAKDSITNLPEGALVVEEISPNTSKPGSFSTKLVVILDDGRRMEVNAPYVVLKPNLHIFEVGQEGKLTKPVDGLPEGATIRQLADVDTSYVHKGTQDVEVTLASGEKRIVAVPYIVIGKKTVVIPKGEEGDFENSLILPEDLWPANVRPVKPLPDTSKVHEGTHRVELLVPGGVALIPVKYIVVDKPGLGNFEFHKLPSKKEIKWNEEIHYSFVVKNNSDAVAKDIRITDEKLNIFDLRIKDELKPGEEYTYRHAEGYKPNENEVKAGVVYNNASVKFNDGEKDITKPNNKDESSAKVKAPVDAEFSIVKQADKREIREGEEIYYSFTVTNLSAFELSNVKLSDEKLGLKDLVIKAKLGIGEQFTYKHEKGYKPTEDEIKQGLVDNVAFVTVKDDDGHETTRKSRPEDCRVTIDKTDYGTPVFNKLTEKDSYSKGEKIYYVFEIINTTKEEITDIRLNDSKLGIIDLKIKDKLAVGEKFVYKHPLPYEMTNEEIKEGIVENEAKINYKDNKGLEREVPAKGPGLKIALKDKAKLFVEVLEVDQNGRMTGIVLMKKTMQAEDLVWGSDYEAKLPEIKGFKLFDLAYNSDPLKGKVNKDEILVSFNFVKEKIDSFVRVEFDNYPAGYKYPSSVNVDFKDKDGTTSLKLKKSDNYKAQFETFDDGSFKLLPEEFEGFDMKIKGNVKDGFVVSYNWQGGKIPAAVTNSGRPPVPATGESGAPLMIGLGLAGLAICLVAVSVYLRKTKTAKE